MTIGTIKVTENYQLTIPKEIRKEISIEAGDEFEIQVNEKKEVLICKVNKGAVEDSFGIWRAEKSGIVYVDEMRDEAEQRLEERDIE